MADRVSKDEVVAFRLNAHHLTERLDEGSLHDAAGQCGLQNSPPGSGILALHARVRGLTQDQVAAAVADEKSLLQTWSMRGAPFYLPTADAPVFTTGVLPPTEEAMRHFIVGVEQSVDRVGISVTEAAQLTAAEIGDVLSGRRLAINELGAEVADRVGRSLPKVQRVVWEAEGRHAAGQPIGEAIVHFCLRILTLQGVVCFAPRAGNKAPFVLTHEWLGHPIRDVDPESARVELLRRYLHCYGPSTRAHFAAWLGVAAGDAGAWWGLVEDDLRPVDLEGATSWLLAEDFDALRSAPEPKAVRLLPPRDPYTQARDRGTIVDPNLHREIWKTVGDPGAVLAQGKVVGTWRPRKRGSRLTLTLKTAGSLPARHQEQIRDEADQIARLRGASSSDVVFDTW